MASIQKTWFIPLIAISIFLGLGLFLSKNRYLLESIYSPKIIYVKIDGNVKNPGIYKMRSGDRLEDLVEKAGGLLDKEKAKNYDPQAPLEDGGTIWLGER